jgi:RimJ/RimL family protein N-acetyltransferase
MSVVLRPVSARAAEALIAGRPPDDVRVADDHPTEFSQGVARSVGGDAPFGPFFLHRAEDDVVVGEIGAAFVESGTLEIGYAVVESARNRGHATDAVRALQALARETPEVERVIGHTPFDRPESGRVLEKAGFAAAGEVVDEHEGETLRVMRWEWRPDRGR